MPRQKQQRCALVVGDRRCQRAGTGSPPLCPTCRRAVAHTSKPPAGDIATVAADVLADFLAGRPINRDATIGAVESMIAQWTASIGSSYMPDLRGVESEGAAHRRAQSGFPRFDDFVDDVVRAGRATRQRARAPSPEESARAAAAAAAAEAAKNARAELGFGVTEVLSEESIRDRRKKLARRHHPDSGGSAAKMAAINNAADVLLAML